MRSIFLEARYTKKIRLPKTAISNLPKKVALFMAVQFLDSQKQIIADLKESGISVDMFQTRHTRYLGQLYGCNNQVFEGDFDAFLYIGDGDFHPKAIALSNKKPIYIYNPIRKRFGLYKNDFYEKEQRRTKGALLKFYTSSNIGILVTLKRGQNKVILGKRLQKKFPKKRFYFLVFDTLDFSRLEDFPFIDVFVSSACERIAFEDREKFPHPVLNAEDIPEMKIHRHVRAS